MGKNKKVLSWLLSILLSTITPIQAGQVITDADREWAKKIADEQGLDAVTTPNTLAVLNYRNMTGNPQWEKMGQGLAYMITTDLVQSSLSESGKINVIERTRLRALLDEQDLGFTGLMAPESVPRMGRLLSAAYVAGGDLNLGQVAELEVDPLLVEVPNDLILDQPQVAGDVADLIRIEKTLLFAILEQMIELTDEERKELAIPITTNLEAWNRFVDGINYSDNGQYSRAAQSYRHALVEDPALNPAREALAELRELGLIAAEGAAPLAGEAVPPPKAPPPSGELGTFGNTALLTGGIAVGLAFAIGVPVIVANQSGDGDDGGSGSTQTPITPPSGGGTGGTEDGTGPTPETITPIVTYTTPATGSEISCESGSVRFHFNKAMYNAFGQISPSIGLWGNDGRSLDWAADDRSVAYVWRATEDACAGFEEAMESTIDFRLYGFRDGEGRFLSGQSTFQYRIGYEEAPVEPPTPVDNTPPVISSTEPDIAGGFTCTGGAAATPSPGTLEVEFNEPMDQSVGSVVLSAIYSGVASFSTSDTLTPSWLSSSSLEVSVTPACQVPFGEGALFLQRLSFSFSGFQDAATDPNPLGVQTIEYPAGFPGPD